MKWAWPFQGLPTLKRIEQGITPFKDSFQTKTYASQSVHQKFAEGDKKTSIVTV